MVPAGRQLYCATRPARCYQPFEHCYQRQPDKGLPNIAARVILARKLARIAFSLMNNQQRFVKNHFPGLILHHKISYRVVMLAKSRYAEGVSSCRVRGTRTASTPAPANSGNKLPADNVYSCGGSVCLHP